MSRLDYDLRSAGAHFHNSVMDTSLIGGGHKHLLNDLQTILQEGEHAHDITQLKLNPSKVSVMTGLDGAHIHEMVMADGTKVLSDPPDGAHVHEVLPDRTTCETGQHIHTVKLPDGTELRTLSPEDIHKEISKGNTRGLFTGLILPGKK